LGESLKIRVGNKGVVKEQFSQRCACLVNVQNAAWSLK
jgi:hypothetical protein